MKKVSVIIPVYNGEYFISKCVESILTQTYKNIEIIIVNDGSSDATKSICEEYKRNNSNIVLINKKNEGPGIARKTGIKEAKGDYISFIDSDDYVDKLFYEKLVNSLEANNVDIVECGYNLVNEKNNLISEHRMKEEFIEGKDDCIKHYIKHINTTNYLVNKLFKKELFNNIEFPQLYAGEDACVLLQLFGNAGRIVVIPDNMYYYVQTSTSLCRKPYNLKKNDSVLAGKFMYNYCKKNCPDNCDYYSLYICSYAAQCYANLRYSKISSKDEHMSYMKQVFKEYYNKENSKIKEVSKLRRGIVKLFAVSPKLSSFIYKKVLKK